MDTQALEVLRFLFTYIPVFQVKELSSKVNMSETSLIVPVQRSPLMLDFFGNRSTHVKNLSTNKVLFIFNVYFARKIPILLNELFSQ